MIKKLTIALSLLTTSGLANASPIDIFNAEDVCTLRVTATGDRFVPPCNFSSTSLSSQTSPTDSNSQMVMNGLFKTQLTYDFICESIRPLTLAYRLNAGRYAQSNGRIAGSRYSEKSNLELTHDKGDATLSIDSLQGATGFQAIKPNCKMTVDQLLTYPEPSYFNLLASNLVNFNGQLANLFNLTSTSTNYLLVINSIDNAILALEMLQFDTEDELLLEFILESVDQLDASKTELLNHCQAGSDSNLCSREIAALRQYLSNSVSLNEQNMQTLVTYLEGQISWLSQYALGRDLLTLQNAYNRLQSQL